MHSDHVAPIGIGWRHAHYGEVLETRPALDFLEVHSENFFADGGAALAVLLQARTHYPISLHGVGLSLGSACGIDDWHLDQLAQLVARVEPIRVSDHACFARGKLAPGQPVHAADLLPVPFSQAALDVMCANVERVQDRLQRPILVENLSAYIQFAGSDRDEPTFLNELAARTGCGLLVDLNNLYVNALNEALAAAEDQSRLDGLTACLRWLDQIAPHTVDELHLAGHRDCGDIVIDDHGSRVCPEVWQIYSYAQQRFAAVPTLVEWDTDIPPLAVLLQEAKHARRLAETRNAPELQL